MDSVGASSFVIVPTPWASVTVTLLLALVKLTVKSSVGSGVVSPRTCTVTNFEVCPGVNVKRPLAEL